MNISLKMAIICSPWHNGIRVFVCTVISRDGKTTSSQVVENLHLTFGNFKVQMTVPADHVVGSTGECQNYAAESNASTMARWQKAQTAKEPVEIVTLEEAKAAEKKKSTAKKTWIFKADNVRDFAWTSSRKFVWDAMPANVEGKKVMCMSFYGKEAYGLYRHYSTKAVAHTIKTYSKFTIPYPYPVAQSVEAATEWNTR